MSQKERAYTNEEFVLILKKAAELAGSSSSRGRIKASLTIEEIKSIAAEAGLDSDSVARAARLFHDEVRPSFMRRIVGGTFRVQKDFSLPGELTDERAQRLLTSARSAMLSHGEGGANASGVSWSTNEPSHVFVSAHGAGAETRVQVAVDNRRALLLPIMLGPAGLVATLYAAIAAGDSGLVNPYLVLAGGGGITVAWVWSTLRRITEKTRATLENLIEAIADAL
jgi:hypothetical protein